MRQLFVAADSALAALSEQGMDACVIEGLAVARWGEPRFTVDVAVIQRLTPLAEFAERPEALRVLQEMFRDSSAE